MSHTAFIFFAQHSFSQKLVNMQSITQTLLVSRKRKSPFQDHISSEQKIKHEKKDHLSDCLDVYYALFAQIFPECRMDVIQLMVEYIALPLYQNATHYGKETYESLTLANDSYYNYLYTSELYGDGSFSLTCNNYLVHIPFLDLLDTLWIKNGKIFIYGCDDDCLEMHDVTNLGLTKKNDEKDKKDMVLSYDPFLKLKRLANIFEIDFASLDYDGYYLYMENIGNIWLYSLQHKDMKCLTNQKAIVESYKVAVDHEDQYFYLVEEISREISVYNKESAFSSLSPILKLKLEYSFGPNSSNLCGLHVFDHYLYMIYQREIYIISLPLFKSPVHVFQFLKMGEGILRKFKSHDLYFTGPASFVNNQLYVVIHNLMLKKDQICILSK